MTKAERTERMRAISKLALGILHRCGTGYVFDRDGMRYRVSEIMHNEFRLTVLRPIVEGSDVSTLNIRFCGKIVLAVEWMPEAVVRTSYKPGEWERALTRYDRTPVLAGS